MITGMEADTCPVADGVTDVTGETFAGVMDAIYLVTPMASQAMDTVTNTAQGLESIFRSGFKNAEASLVSLLALLFQKE